MIQRGIVVGKKAERAIVKISRCVGCKGEKSCPFSLDMTKGKAHEIQLEAIDPIGVSIGSFVHIQAEAGPIVKGIFLVYVLSLLLMSMGMGLVYHLTGGAILPTLGGGLVGLLIWYGVIKHYNAEFQENYRIVQVETSLPQGTRC
ncbi:MAG: SoxR reducing system RseC family protein [Limnochordia bacterium]|jgi:positive regulator of sigma E activity